MQKIAVILSGCGVFDGSEINEVVLTLLALEQAGLSYQAIAPNNEQDITNHLSKQAQSQRNILEESARIMRGNIIALDEADPADFAAVIFPGGFGVVQNLCDFASQGEAMTVRADVLAFAQAISQANKPAGFICIAPVMIPAICGQNIPLTIGNDAAIISKVEAMGGIHQNCPVDDIVADESHKVVSTPAYMLANGVSEANSGIQKLVQRIATWLQ